MSITAQGINAEKKARDFLRSKKIFDIQQFDWFVKHNDEHFIVEVKQRELYQPPPFLGTGLDILQIERRRKIYIDLKIDTLLLVFTDTYIYYQFIFNKLEKTKYFDTKNKIRIYDIKYFRKEKT